LFGGASIRGQGVKLPRTMWIEPKENNPGAIRRPPRPKSTKWCRGELNAMTAIAFCTPQSALRILCVRHRLSISREVEAFPGNSRYYRRKLFALAIVENWFNAGLQSNDKRFFCIRAA
jgi:hypothetical protein